MKLKVFFLATLFLFSCRTSSQSYIGYAVDNYSGIHGVLFNPASVVDSNFRTDINLFSVSTFVGSDYFGIDLKTALESKDGFTIEGDVQRFPKEDNQFFLNFDVLGPSVMFNLSPKSSIAITTRVRAFMNLNNINGTLFESLEEGFDEEEDFDFALNNFSGTIHSWGEIGLTYGRIILNEDSNFLKGGVTLKYLQGAGSNFTHSSAASGSYDADTRFLNTSGSLSYGYTEGFNTGDIDYSNLTSGFGADLGLVYELRPEDELDLEAGQRGHSDYKLKLGLSITDLGSIKYSGSTVTTYDLENSISGELFEEEDLQGVLEGNYGYEGTEEVVEAKINLPTAMHALVDYKFRNRLFMAVHGSFSLVEEGKEQTNRIINTVTAVPRFESRWFSFYIPVGVRQYDGFSMGAGLRLGPLSVGSGSVISNYFTDSAKTADFYFGLKIPVYR